MKIERGQRWQYKQGVYNFIIEIFNPDYPSGQVIQNIGEKCCHPLNQTITGWTITTESLCWTYLKGQDRS